MPIEQAINKLTPTATLSSGIDADDTSLSVSSAANFPTSPQFRIRIEDELLLVTGVAGTTFTVTRGIEGSTATTHAADVDVTQVITKQALINLVQYYSKPPQDRAPAIAGDYDEEFDGTEDTLPTDWSWQFSLGFTSLYVNSRWPSLLVIENTTSQSHTLRRTSFSPDPTFGLWAKLILGHQVSSGTPGISFGIYNSGNTDARVITFEANGSTVKKVSGSKVVSSVTSAAWASGSVNVSSANELYVGFTRISDSWKGWFSTNGIAWDCIGNTADSHTFTPDRFQFSFSSASAAWVMGLDWVRYREDNAFPRYDA
jgi:hypothetical protein